MGEFRDGVSVTTEAVTLILSTIDRIKITLEELEAHQREPTGHDADLIERLNRLARRPERGLQSGARKNARPPPESSCGPMLGRRPRSATRPLPPSAPTPSRAKG